MRKFLSRLGIFSFIITVIFTAGHVFAASPKMAEALQPFIDRGEMPGIISVLATKDRVIQIDCVGYADCEAKKPIAPDQVFWIASTTKFFTGTAVMMLVDEGKVSLDDPVEKYIPEVKEMKIALVNQENLQVLQTPNQPITVRQALSHQTGLPFQTKMMDKFGSDCLPLPKEIFEITRTATTFQPGTDYSYSELGIDLAGGVIEAVTGKPYEDFIQERILTPLGMNDTSFWPSVEVQKERWIHCYQPAGEGSEGGKLVRCDIPMMTKPYEDKTVRFPEPGSGLFSTANDLTKFFQMHAGGGVYQGKRYLSQAAIDEINTRQTPDEKFPYGITNMMDGKWFGHAGACGNQCFASTDGFVRLYIVQIVNIPQHQEAMKVWREVSDEILANETP